jgi:hypothetical protein
MTKLYFVKPKSSAECKVYIVPPNHLEEDEELIEISLSNQEYIHLYSDIYHEMHFKKELIVQKVIYTSYYSKVKSLDIPKERLYSISNASFYKDKVYDPLVPPWELVNKYKQGKINEREYFQIYKKEVLSKLNAQKVVSDLGYGAVLLCFEKPSDFCHRQIVAKWLEHFADVEVVEV